MINKQIPVTIDIVDRAAEISYKERKNNFYNRNCRKDYLFNFEETDEVEGKDLFILSKLQEV